MRTTARRTRLPKLPAIVAGLVTLLTLAAAVILGPVGTIDALAAPAATESAAQPTDNPTDPDISPSDVPTTADPAQPTVPKPPGPTTTNTSVPTTPQTGTASPSATPTATPSSASPTPSRSATPTPVAQRPATPPAAASTNVPVWSVVIALVVLAIAVVVLIRLSRSAPPSVGPGASTTTIHPVDDGSETLVLMSGAGEAMIDSGYDVTSVQAAMDDIAAAHGLPRAESIALPTAILVSARIRGQVRTNAVTTGRQVLRLHQVEDLDEVITDARRGMIAPADAVAAIARIRALPPTFSAPVQLAGSVLTSIALSVLLGAAPIGIGVSAVLGALVGALLLAGARIPRRYQVLVTVLASFLVALAVFLLSRTHVDFGVLPALIAPLALLLPGALLTTSVIELATGQMISGAGRLAAGAMQLVLLALGIVAAAALVGIPAIDLSTSQTPLGPFGPWLAVAVFGFGVVLNRVARLKSVGWILIVLYVAYGAQVVGNLFLGGVLSAFVGAAAMTPVAAVVARQRSGPPAMVSFTPAFWLLVPGALGLVGVTTILDGDTAGLQTLLTTSSTMVAIALGVLIGWALTGTLRRLRRRRESEH